MFEFRREEKSEKKVGKTEEDCCRFLIWFVGRMSTAASRSVVDDDYNVPVPVPVALELSLKLSVTFTSALCQKRMKCNDCIT